MNLPSNNKMITYDNLWDTMKKKGITKYALTYKYGVSPSTIIRLRRNDSITMYTLNQLCDVLKWEPSDVLTFTPDPLDDSEAAPMPCLDKSSDTSSSKTQIVDSKSDSSVDSDNGIHAFRLSNIMKERSINVRKLQELSDVPAPTIRNILYGKTKNPRIETLMSIASALNIKVEEL